jgi:hypothetical protein
LGNHRCKAMTAVQYSIAGSRQSNTIYSTPPHAITTLWGSTGLAASTARCRSTASEEARTCMAPDRGPAAHACAAAMWGCIIAGGITHPCACSHQDPAAHLGTSATHSTPRVRHPGQRAVAMPLAKNPAVWQPRSKQQSSDVRNLHTCLPTTCSASGGGRRG